MNNHHTHSTPNHYNPAIILGPGVWFALHLQAFHATTSLLKEALVAQINNIQQKFKCSHCRQHMLGFMTRVPLYEYWDRRDPQGRELGFFYWTYIFHNEVNISLGKNSPSYEEIYNYYHDEGAGVCSSCLETTPEEVPSRRIIIPLNQQDNGLRILPLY